MDCSKRKQFLCIKIFIFLTSFLTLIQGVGYLGLSIWSILVHNCLQIPIKSPLEKVIYFIYFRNGECQEVNWLNEQNFVIPNMPIVTKIASRTFYIFIFYAIISTLWIITSLMVLGAFCSIVNRRAYNVCFLPWLIFILLGSALDVISTVFFVNDFFYTTTVDKALDYLSVQNREEMMKVLKDYEEYFSYPAIRLSLLSSRCIIVWIYNIIAVICSVKLISLIIKTRPSVISNDKSETDDSKQFSTLENNLKNNNTYNRMERRTLQPLKNGEQIISIKNAPISLPKKPTKIDKNEPQVKYNFKNYNESDQNYQIELQNSQPKYYNFSHNMEYDKSISSDSPHYCNLNSLPRNNSENKSYEYIYAAPSSSRSNKSNDIVDTNVNNIAYSSPDKPDRRSVNLELRSQLPWSYFGAMNDDTPKHILNHISNSPDKHVADEHEILPPIPVPDYTLHFPKEDRPSVVKKNFNNRNNQHMNQSNLKSIPPSPPRNTAKTSR